MPRQPQPKARKPVEPNDDNVVEKFNWTNEWAHAHLEICVAGKHKGNWLSTCLNEIGRQNLRAEFFRRFGEDWPWNKFKNRLDTVRRSYEKFKLIIPDISGLTFCEETGAISMPPSWWNNLIKEKPQAKKFRNYPLRDIQLLDKLFGDVSISVGEDGWQHHDGPSRLPREGISGEEIGTSIGDESPPLAQNSEQSEIPPRGNVRPLQENNRHGSRQSKSSKRSKSNQWDRLLDLIEDQGTFFKGGRETFDSLHPYSSAACVKELKQMTMMVQRGELYWAALAFLEENEQRRQIFLTLPSEEEKIEYLERMTGKMNMFSS